MHETTDSLHKGNRDDEIKVIISEGAEDRFREGFDFPNGVEHTPMVKKENRDLGRDAQIVTDPHLDYMPTFMGWH